VSEPAALRIPDDLLPADGRFGCGPSRLPNGSGVVLASAEPAYMGRSHRDTKVIDLVARVRRGMRDFFGLPEGYEVVLGNGGATTFWDVAAYSLIRRRSEHLVFGEFSDKFARSAAAPHLEAPLRMEAPAGSRPEVVVDPRVDAYALTHNETSTGVWAPVARPSGPDGSLVLVDATSAAGAIEVEPAAFDAYYFSPQKAFGADGGLWIALLSPAALARIEEIRAQRYIPPTLDLAEHVASARKDQTTNTPAIATLLLLEAGIAFLTALGGLSAAASRSRFSSGILYAWAGSRPWAHPYVGEPSFRSPVVATVELDPAIDAGTLRQALAANGIYDVAPYRKLGGNGLRLGLFPAVEPGDVEAFCACVDWLVERM